MASRLRGIRASQIMTPDPVTVPGSMTVSEFLEDNLPRLNGCAERRALVFSNGHLAGIITPSDITPHGRPARPGPVPVTADRCRTNPQESKLTGKHIKEMSCRTVNDRLCRRRV
jgi:hypothetical protein